MAVNADEIRALLRLVPHRAEGGCFIQTYRSDETLERAALPSRYTGDRAFGTAIYYLLAPGTCSALHRLRSDEVFHFYLGDPVEMLLLPPGEPGAVAVLGADLAGGMRPQIVVPRGVWQGSRLVAGGSAALLGTTVAPGFDSADFELGERAALIREWPAWAEQIRALTSAE
jgi:predicted cupin superfamily sugar epimerase